jgi:MtN3 and saliva related transmembrane protein
MSLAVLETTAAAWGVVMAVSPVLQVRRMLLTRSAEDVSTGYFLLLIPGFLLWVAYGIASGDLFLAIPNAIAAIVAVALLGVAITLRRKVSRDGHHPAHHGKPIQI